MPDAKREGTDECPAQFAGYDGWFGVYCELPRGHDGMHEDGQIRWWDLRDGPLPVPESRDA